MLCGAASTDEAAFLAELASLEALGRRDPVKDARAAAGRRDFHFLAIAGYAIQIPGVDLRMAQCDAIRHKAVVVRGTSDLVIGDRHAAAIAKASEYATSYNAHIVSHPGFKLPKTCSSGPK